MKGESFTTAVRIEKETLSDSNQWLPAHGVKAAGFPLSLFVPRLPQRGDRASEIFVEDLETQYREVWMWLLRTRGADNVDAKRVVAGRAWRLTPYTIGIAQVPGPLGILPIDRECRPCPFVTFVPYARAQLVPLDDHAKVNWTNPWARIALYFPEGVCPWPDWRVWLWQLVHWTGLGFKYETS